MGDAFDFPYNDEMYFKQANDYFENKDYDKALQAIEKVYVNDNRPTITYLYTLILYTLERYEEALDIADKQKDFYLSIEEYTVSYVMLLIKKPIIH